LNAEKQIHINANARAARCTSCSKTTKKTFGPETKTQNIPTKLSANSCFYTFEPPLCKTKQTHEESRHPVPTQRAATSSIR
jgi:hypothetical protein